MPKRPLLLLLAAILNVVAVVTAADADKSLPPQIWRVGNGAEPQDLDPQAIQGVPEENIVMALFEGLASEDPHDLHPVPGVATSWDISPDGLVYTFHLRENARWSNGDPLTSDDFIQSYRRILTAGFGSEYAYLLYDYVLGAREYYDGKLTDFSQVGLKAPDAHTLQVTLKSCKDWRHG